MTSKADDAESYMSSEIAETGEAFSKKINKEIEEKTRPGPTKLRSFKERCNQTSISAIRLQPSGSAL